MLKISKNIERIVANPVFISAMFALMLLIRLVNLHADPSPVKFQSEIVDEGFWIHNARAMAVFGSWHPDDLVQAFVGAPLFTYLMFLSFKLFGVGFFSARLVSAIAGWLTLLAVYFMLKKEFPVAVAAGCAVLLGFMIEFLTYNRVAFPETLQTFFVTMVFLFWAYSDKRPWLGLLSGACLILAFMSKISAYCVFPSMIVLWAVLWYAGRFDLRTAAYFCLGFAASATSWFFFFFIPNSAYYAAFFSTHGRYIMEGGGFGPRLVHAVTFFYNYIFTTPSVLLMIVLLLAYSIDLVRKLNGSPKNHLRRMSMAELMCLSWIGGTSIIYAMTADTSHRRLIMLMVPIAILATVALFRSRQISKSMSSGPIPATAAAAMSMFALYLFLTCTGSFFTLSVLLLLLFVYLAVKERAARISMIAFAWSTLIFLPFAAGSADGLSDTLLGLKGPAYPAAFLAIAAILLSFLFRFFIKKDSRTVFAQVIILLIAWNLVMDGAYLLRPTFTLFNASRYIGSITKQGDIFAGGYSHLLSLENGILPLWWSPDSRYQSDLNRENIYLMYPRYLMFTDRTFLEPQKANSLNSIRLFNNEPVVIKRLNLLPYLFGGGYYRVFNLIELRRIGHEKQ